MEYFSAIFMLNIKIIINSRGVLFLWTVIAHLFPWRDLEKCMYRNFLN